VTPILLLADDSVTIRRVIELTFADEDIQVVTVGDGDQAIAALGATPPDIVLADVGMPGRNGYEVAEYIRSTPALAHTRVVLLTGAFEPVDEERAAALRCDGILAKPFEPQQVIARVRRLLAGASSDDGGTGDDALRGDDAGAGPADARRGNGDAPLTDAGSRDRIDAYFDRLDQAFIERSGATPAAAPAAAAEMPAARAAAAEMAAGLVERGVPGGPDVGASAAGIAHRPRLIALPTLAEAFAALLASEGQDGGSGESGWPAAAAVPTEALAEDVTRMVLDRMPDTVIRAAVSDVVAAVAERLVREEIERLKASVDLPDDE
jgi:CheY-like chemotaxis protein